MQHSQATWRKISKNFQGGIADILSICAMDCLTLPPGSTLFVSDIIGRSEKVTDKNFYFPSFFWGIAVKFCLSHISQALDKQIQANCAKAPHPHVCQISVK